MTNFRIILELPGSPGPLGNLENLEVSGKLEVTKDSNKSRSRFNLDDVRFFNSFYESKFVDIILVIEYTKKSTFFWNVYIFINRVKDIARTKGNELLR